MERFAPTAARARTRPTTAAAVAPWALVGVAFCVLGAHWVHAATGFGGPGTDDFFGRWVYDAVVALSASAALLRGFGERPVRGVWVAFGLALAAVAVGDVIYSLAGNLAAVPVPSLSDPFWLAFYPLAYVGVLLLVRDRVRTALVATRLDGLICGVTAASLLACVTLGTAFSNSAGAAFWEQATDLAYPVGDLILLGGVVSAVAVSGWRIDRTLGVLAASVVLWETADVIYMFPLGATAGNIADALVLTGSAGIALAATLDRAPAWRYDDRERGVFVAVAFGAVALAVLIGGAALRLEIAGLALAAIALALVLVRMALALSENRALLGESRVQATTDPLTGLGNRRKLKGDLTIALTRARASDSLALVILDLNGFKTYNDTFGHAAGDMLLAQLGRTLAAAIRGRGEAYRMGGDEFCVLSPCDGADATEISLLCTEALTTRGEGFSVSAACGIAMLPSEEHEVSSALALADARMYRNKAAATRPSVVSDAAKVLCAVLEERAPALAGRSKNVRELSMRTGERLGLDDEELEALGHAAELHDLGKLAIPDSILEKPGPLLPDEWELVRQHPIIGERILLAAPALQRAAQLVRSSHERLDGTGYPDGLRGEEIPLASRVIAVADAYDAMTSPRPYKPTFSSSEAVAELRRCAGSQFDRHVAAEFEAALTAIPTR